MEELIEINDKIKLSTTGDIANIPSINFLYDKNFLKYNNNYFEKSFDKNRNYISSLFNKISFLKSIKNNLDRTKNFQVIFPKGVLEKLNSGDLEWVKSKSNDGLLTAMIKEKGSYDFKHQIKLKEVFINNAQLNNVLSSIQMLTIQSAIESISSQIESLDSKLNEVINGIQNDRMAWIQSGYNLFLQAKVSKKLRNNLYPIAIGQLNLGREQLIFSLENDVKDIFKYKTGFRSFTQQVFSNEDIMNVQREKINRIKQSLNFIIRSSQILTIIYQDYNEKWSMLQSYFRLRNVLEVFNSDFFNKLNDWDTEKEFNISENNMELLKKSFDSNIISLTKNPKQIALNIT